MARKSAALRLQESELLLSQYDAAGFGKESGARFLRDMVPKMYRGKYPTARQRQWLDKLIEAGVPEPKGDKVYLAEIDEALKLENFEEAQFLRDFRGHVAMGRSLSVKQKAWSDRLIKKSKDIQSGNQWKPSAKTTKRLKIALSVRCCYGRTYWGTHTYGAAALDHVEEWLDGTRDYIEEKMVLKALKSVTGKLALMEKPKFAIGSMAYFYKKPCIILDGPKPCVNGIEYSVLMEGKIHNFTNLTKRSRG